MSGVPTPTTIGGCGTGMAITAPARRSVAAWLRSGAQGALEGSAVAFQATSCPAADALGLCESPGSL